VRELSAAHTEAEHLRVGREGDNGWQLLLARVERHWAGVVNAGADERGVVDGPRSAQLIQAVQRELERLREEVGVETTLAPGAPVEDELALMTLLAVGEAAAVLASCSEAVAVELGAPAVVAAQDWTGDDEDRRRLDEVTAMTGAAGLAASVEVAERVAQIVLGDGPTSAP
jgi:hypothetical protein